MPIMILVDGSTRRVEALKGLKVGVEGCGKD